MLTFTTRWVGITGRLMEIQRLSEEHSAACFSLVQNSWQALDRLSSVWKLKVLLENLKMHKMKNSARQIRQKATDCFHISLALISFAFRLFWEKEAQEKGIYQTEKTEASHLFYVGELYWKETQNLQIIFCTLKMMVGKSDKYKHVPLHCSGCAGMSVIESA